MHALRKVGVLVSKNIRLQSPWNDVRTDVQNNGFDPTTPPLPPYLLWDGSTIMQEVVGSTYIRPHGRSSRITGGR